MVEDRVWRASGLTPRGGFLCIRDLERRLGRALSGRDFKVAPVNVPGRCQDTPRLAMLKHAFVQMLSAEQLAVLYKRLAKFEKR